MHRIDAAGATADHKFTLGNPSLGVPATTLDAEWPNAVQEELCNFIASQGVTLVKGTWTQLGTAIAIAISAGISACASVSGDFDIGGKATAKAYIIDQDYATPGAAQIRRNGNVFYVEAGTAGGVLATSAGSAVLTWTSALLTVAVPLSVTDATDTTSGSTGAIYTAGGIGVTKKLYVGGAATFATSVDTPVLKYGTSGVTIGAAAANAATVITLRGSSAISRIVFQTETTARGFIGATSTNSFFVRNAADNTDVFIIDNATGKFTAGYTGQTDEHLINGKLRVTDASTFLVSVYSDRILAGYNNSTPNQLVINGATVASIGYQLAGVNKYQLYINTLQFGLYSYELSIDVATCSRTTGAWVFPVSIDCGHVAVFGNGNEIQLLPTINADGDVYWGYKGYNGGTTKFRSTHFCNGKGVIVGSYLGDTGAWTRGTASVASSHTDNGYVSINGGGTSGTATTEHPYLACKTIKGTIGAGPSLNIAHGISSGKARIAYISIKVYDGTYWLSQNTRSFLLSTVSWDDTYAIYTSNDGTQNGKAIEFFIYYEAA